MQNYHLHDAKQNIDYRTNDQKLDSPKLEDSNSNNSLLIDERLNNDNLTSQVYVIENNKNDDFYNENEHYGPQLYKCEVCFAVFPNNRILAEHLKESHRNTEVKVSYIYFCLK